MDFLYGPYHIDVNIDKTQGYYAKEYDIGCDCKGCKNFVQTILHLPEDVKAFFSQFGVDPAKPAEISTYHSVDGIETLYGGFYHICGTILSGKNPWVQVAKKQYRLNDEYAIKLSNGFSFYFTEDCSLVDESFPTPVIQMEFTGNLPWVIDEPNPYT